MSSSPGTNDGELRRLSTTILRLSNNAQPDHDGLHASFLKELKRHISIFPDDTNFYVVSQPGAGFGFAVCLEDGCENANIRLGSITDKSVSDKGISAGIGALANYRSHVNNHQTHKTMRNRRVKESNPSRSQSIVNKVPLSGSSPIKLEWSSSGGQVLSKPTAGVAARSEMPSQTRPALISIPTCTSVKQEDMDIDISSSLTRKRCIDIFSSHSTLESSPLRQRDLSGMQGHSSEPSGSTFGNSLVTKKPKLEHTTPVSFLHQRASASQSPSHAQAIIDVTKMSSQERLEALKGWSRSLSVLEMTRDSLKRKKRASSHDVSRLRETVRRIAEAEAMIMHLTSGDQASDSPAERISAASIKTEWTSSDFSGPGSSTSSPDTSIMEFSFVREKEDIKPPVPNVSRNQSMLVPQPAAASSSSIKLEEAAPALPSLVSVQKPSQPTASSSAVTMDKTSSLSSQANVATNRESVVDLYARNFRSGAMVSAADEGYMDVSDSENEYSFNARFVERRGGKVGGSSNEDLRQYLISMAAEILPENEDMAKRLDQLGLTAENTVYKGMHISLLHHQVSGVGWMLDKEQGKDMGGILADEMGLGKTVQTIACMLGNRSQDPAVKTTLVLTPVSLLEQWKFEIERVSNKQLSVLIYHGSHKVKSKKELQKFDVVLTTHQTVAFEWPDWDEEKLEKSNKQDRSKRTSDGFIASDSEDEKPKPKKKKQKYGLLLQMNWYRVVIDEAQVIRNKTTRVSRAVYELNSEYRWCLTGTPIINGLQDAYGLLRFLRIRPWYDWVDFRDHVMLYARKSPSLATNRLQGIFQTCLLRRRKDTKIDGKPLINLPPKDVQLVMLEFTPEERDIYKMVETRSQITFNRYLRAGTVLKNYAHVLILLLRLRQICSHTSLIAESEGKYVINENEPDQDADDAKRALTIEKAQFVNTLKERMREKALALIQAEKLQHEDGQVAEDEDCPICFDNFTDAVYTSCMHVFCRECIMEHINNSRDQEHHCPACRSPIEKHRLYRRSAFEPTDEELGVGRDGESPKAKEEPMDDSLPNDPKTEDDDDDMPNVSDLLATSQKGATKGKGKAIKKTRPIRNCRKKRFVSDTDDEQTGADDLRYPEAENDSNDDDYEGGELDDFIVPDDEDEEQTNKRLRRRRISKGKRPAVVSDSDDSDDDDVRRPRGQNAMDLDDVAGPVKTLEETVPSTKMKHMMDRLVQLAQDYPEEKTIVISQWTQCLQICAACLKSKDIQYVKYTGAMRREHRDAAVHKFMRREDKTVMLLSLKAGGVGLNLTRANRVINMDLGWSEAVEDQAFDRVHRLGQRLPVFVERLIIKDTVENRVLALQQQKKSLADGSLGEGSGKKIKRLNVRELANLFGLDIHGNVLE